MAFFPITQIQSADSPSVTAFGRWRTANPTGLFDAQFTYNLNNLLYEQITNGSGASIAHDATDRDALLTFASTATGGKAYMQSYDYHRYQPGKSQLIFVTFNMLGGATNVLKFAGYSDGVNGLEFQLNGTTPRVALYSATGHGNEFVDQTSWNLDKMDGTGPSGITLATDKVQILVIDLQALYVGRVRIGFDIGGIIYYVHQFLHANLDTNPYIQSANLPVRCGMTCTGTVSTTMKFVCSSVISEGGSDDTNGRTFSIEGSVTAGNNTRTHILSIRPKTTFNSITNRIKFDPTFLSFFNSNINNGVLWELVIGQAITGTTTFADCNATYSGFEYNVAGTASGSPAVVIAAGYVPSNNSGAVDARAVVSKYPITLDAAGAVRALGTLSLLVTGIGGTAATRASVNWKEIR